MKKKQKQTIQTVQTEQNQIYHIIKLECSFISYKELAEHDSVQYMAGGSCQNSLRVAQWIIRKPRVAVFFGCVGVDDYGEKLAEKARADGVNVIYQQNNLLPTGTCAVAITNHQRSLCANLAAANTFTVDHINQPENRKVVNNAKYFYVTGFFLTASFETVQAIAKHALAENAPFLMNLSAPFIAQFYKKELMEALPFADIVFGNETGKKFLKINISRAVHGLTDQRLLCSVHQLLKMHLK